MAQERFANWDCDQDRVLTIAEIDAVVADANFVGSEAAAIAALKRASRNSRYKLKQFSVPDIEQLVAAGPGKDRPDLRAVYKSGQERIEQIPLDDFVVQFAGMARETDLPAGDEPELPKLPGELP